MEKHIALLVVALLTCFCVLTACNSAATTDNAKRWDDGDTFTYNITLADFAETGSNALFNSYKNGDATHYKDMVISTSGANEVSAYKKDEIVPAAATGTYVLSYAVADEKCTVKGVQTMEVTYNKVDIVADGDLTKLANWETLKEKVKESDDPSQVVFTSSTETTVVFQNDERQRPLSSSTVVDGFYIGKSKQEVSKSNVSTVYDLDNGKVTVTVDGKETVNEVKYNSAKRIIDANQVLTYIRSLEKGSDKFKDSPSVQAYLPASNQLYTATFGFTYQQNCILTKGEKDNFVKLNSVNCAIGSMAFMQTQNVPDLSDKDVDYTVGGTGTKMPCYTVTRFRVGNFSYALDLQLWDKADAVISALTATEEK